MQFTLRLFCFSAFRNLSRTSPASAMRFLTCWATVNHRDANILPVARTKQLSLWKKRTRKDPDVGMGESRPDPKHLHPSPSVTGETESPISAYRLSSSPFRDRTEKDQKTMAWGITYPTRLHLCGPAAACSAFLTPRKTLCSIWEC